MPGPGNPNGSDRKMTIDGMLNDVNSALNSNAVAGPNDWNGADPDASGNTNLDDMGKNTPNRTCMVGPNQMHRDNVSESSGTTDHDSRINNAQNRPALVGSIYKSDASVDVDGMIWTPDSLESPDSSPGSSSLNTSDTSPRSAVPSNSPIPQLDGVYLQAIKNLERVPSGSIIGLLEQIQALLADRGVGRSELEGEWLTKYLGRLVSINEARYGTYPNLGLLHIRPFLDENTSKHMIALVLLKDTKESLNVVWSSKETETETEAQEMWVGDLRDDGETAARAMVVPKEAR